MAEVPDDVAGEPLFALGHRNARRKRRLRPGDHAARIDVRDKGRRLDGVDSHAVEKDAFKGAAVSLEEVRVSESREAGWRGDRERDRFFA